MSKFQESDHYYHYEQQPNQKGCLHVNGIYYQHKDCDHGIESPIWRAFHQVEDIIKMPGGIYIKWKNSSVKPDDKKEEKTNNNNNNAILTMEALPVQVDKFKERQEKRNDNINRSSIHSFFNTDFNCKKQGCKNARFQYTLKCKEHQNSLLTFKEMREMNELHINAENLSSILILK